MITHQYGDRAGVRYMTNGLKVYYTPFQPFHEGDTISTYYATFPLFRKIMIREQIDIVHCHQVCFAFMSQWRIYLNLRSFSSSFFHNVISLISLFKKPLN